MKKISKVITMALAAITVTSALGVSAMAADDQNDSVLKANDNSRIEQIDDELVYIPEHAEIIEQYNTLNKKTRASSYSAWSWSSGIFSMSMGRSSAAIIPYYFVPTGNYLYFNVEVEGSSKVPYLTVNKYNNGSLEYKGSYNITSSGSNTYAWNNKKRSLTAGDKYVFALLDDTNWSSASIDIYKSSL